VRAADAPLVHRGLRLRHWAVCTLAGVPSVAVTLRPAVPGEADALSRLALRSKGHWGYDEDFLAACRVEPTLQPEQCDGVHTVVAEHGDALLGFYRLAGEAPVAELADLFVDPTAIGRGGRARR
jgi:hypothetical protein